MKPYLFIVLLLSGVAHGQVYQCVNEFGKTTYTDTPCKGNEENVAPDAKEGADLSSSAIVNGIPESVATVKYALKFIGLNQIVLLNLDQIEQFYVVPQKPFNYYHSFLVKGKYDYGAGPNHEVSARFINGKGTIKYVASVYLNDWANPTPDDFFNANFDDVNKRMMAMGLEDKARDGVIYSYGYWRWQYRAFSCRTYANFKPQSTVIKVEVTCNV